MVSEVVYVVDVTIFVVPEVSVEVAKVVVGREVVSSSKLRFVVDD